MATEVTTEDLATAALNPAQVSGDQGSVTTRTIDELEKARNAIAADTSASKNHRGLRFGKFIPGDTVS